MNNPGLLRKFLIAIILLVSLSAALIYFFFTQGMYTLEAPEYKALVLENGLVYAGVDQRYRRQRIVIKSDLIHCMGSECEVPADAKVVDVSGKAIIPAFMDLGIQFYRNSGESQKLSSFKQFVSFTRQRPEVRKNLHKAGITTIRSVGDAPQNILTLREQVRAGKLAGPRIYASGLMISKEGGYPAKGLYEGNDFMLQNGVRYINGPNSVGETLEELVDLGVDGIKIVYNSFGGKYSIMEIGELEALIERAADYQLWVSVLTGSNQELQDALNAGAKCVELGSTELLSNQNLILLQEKDALYLPMLSGMDPGSEVYEIQSKNVRALAQVGARIGVATDIQTEQFHGDSYRRELELLAKAGVPASTLLRAASLEGAIALKKDDLFGTLEVGKVADIAVMEGKPWENIKDIRNITHLIQNGQLVLDEGELLDL